MRSPRFESISSESFPILEILRATSLASGSTDELPRQSKVLPSGSPQES
jgi:hypothetical protein